MEERTGWRGQNKSQIVGEEKRNNRLETSKVRAEWRRLQRKNLNILGLPKRKEWPRCHIREQLASTPEPPLPKGKRTEPSVQSTRSRGKRESRWARAAPWRERGEIRARTWRGKGGLHCGGRQIPRRKGRAS